LFGFEAKVTRGYFLVNPKKEGVKSRSRRIALSPPSLASALTTLAAAPVGTLRSRAKMPAMQMSGEVVISVNVIVAPGGSRSSST
jgi:hypothetical protein